MSVWLDFALVLVLLAGLALMVRLRSTGAALAFQPPAPAPGTGALSRLRSLFARVARQAGFDPQLLGRALWPAKVAVAALLPLLALELGARWGPAGLLAAGLVGFFSPDVWLLLVRRRRRQRVRTGLSFFLDLLVSLLESGLTIEAAFRRVGTEGLDRGHPLAREASLVGLELVAGKGREAAFRSLAERTGVRELQTVAAALALGLRVGSPLATTLKAQADLLREHRREAARQRIQLAQLKSLLPLMLCGFPIFLVLVVFPALVEIFDVLREISTLF